MDTVVSLAGARRVATHYGLYNTVCGIDIAVGNLGTGAALDASRAHGLAWMPRVTLTVIGALCALGVRALARSGRLERCVAEPATT